MEFEQTEFKHRVLDLVMGEFDSEKYPVPEAQLVKSEFEEGSFCSNAYEDALRAYSNLCKRLNVPDRDDRDVEAIFHSLHSITSFLGIKMYEYGVFFAKNCNSSEIHELLFR